MKVARRQVRADVPSVAMGDIAFLLLIFFFILARAEDDSHLKWQPAHIPEIENLGATDLSVLIDKDSKTHLNGAAIGAAQLAGQLKTRLEGRGAGQRKVRLKVHRDAHASYFEPVIEAISEAGGELEHVLEQEQKK